MAMDTTRLSSNRKVNVELEGLAASAIDRDTGRLVGYFPGMADAMLFAYLVEATATLRRCAFCNFPVLANQATTDDFCHTGCVTEAAVEAYEEMATAERDSMAELFDQDFPEAR